MSGEQLTAAQLDGLRRIGTEHRPYVPEGVRDELARRELIGPTERPEGGAWLTVVGCRVLDAHEAGDRRG